MKSLTLALLLVSGYTQAAVINYQFEGQLYSHKSGYETWSTGTMTVDTDTTAITEFFLNADFGSYAWSGTAVLDGEPVTDDYWTHVISTINGDGFGLMLHLSFLNENWNATNFLHHLELNQSGEFNWEFGTPALGGLAFTPSFIKVSTSESPAEVPEPASIALLGLGLAGLGFRKRLPARS